MSNEIEQYQLKQTRLNYILNLWQFFAVQKKEFTLVQRLEEEVKKAVLTELPEETEDVPVTPSIIQP